MKFKIYLRAMGVNQAWKIGSRGKRAFMYMSKEYKEYKEKFQAELERQMKLKKIDVIDGDININNIVFSYKGMRRKDVDAGLKPLLDCMEGVLFKDDFCVQEMNVKKLLGQDVDYIEFEVEVL